MRVTRRGFFARLGAAYAAIGYTIFPRRRPPELDDADDWKRERIRVFARGTAAPPAGPQCVVELEAPEAGRRQCVYLEPNAMFIADRDMVITGIRWATAGVVGAGAAPTITVTRDGPTPPRTLKRGDLLKVRFS